MSDIVERLRNGEPCRATSGVRCRFMDARYGCLCAIAADEITRLTAENEKLAEAVLCAALMLSERGLSSAEKCEMAYDYLSEIHAALSGDKP